MNGHTKSTPVTEEKKEIKEKQDNSVFLVEVNVERLVNLENGGYGPSAILKYRKLCQRIMDSNLSESDKYIQIKKPRGFVQCPAVFCVQRGRPRLRSAVRDSRAGPAFMNII